MINELIPQKYRRPVYVTYALIGIVLGAIQVGYAEAGVEAPTWLGVAFGVYAFVGGAVGITAAIHTPGKHARVVDTTTGAQLSFTLEGLEDPEAVTKTLKNVKRRDLRE